MSAFMKLWTDTKCMSLFVLYIIDNQNTSGLLKYLSRISTCQDFEKFYMHLQKKERSLQRKIQYGRRSVPRLHRWTRFSSHARKSFVLPHKYTGRRWYACVNRQELVSNGKVILIVLRWSRFICLLPVCCVSI